MTLESEIIIGVEGGASSTKALLISRSGSIVSSVIGPQTNLTLLGMNEMINRLSRLLEDLLKSAKMTGKEKIDYLGLSLSGIDNAEEENDVLKEIKAVWKSEMRFIKICNDTVGSLRTAADSGVVLIAGTGSNCRLIHKDGSCERVGGWGTIFGDQGSAYGIVYDGVKRMIEHVEGLTPCILNIDAFYEKCFSHFRVTDLYDLIPEFYMKFDKTHFSRFCVDIAEMAANGDDFCRLLFRDAGYVLGRHVATMARNCENEILEREGLHVICVGSVWKSWDLLKEGFMEGIQPCYRGLDKLIRHICLKRLTVSAAIGAAYLATEMEGGNPMQHNYKDNCEIFFNM